MPRQLKKNNSDILIIFLIFFIFTVSIITTGYIYYSIYEKQYRSRIEQELNVIAELKANEIGRYRKERIADGNMFSNNPVFVSLVKSYLFQNDAQSKERLHIWLTKCREHYQYKNISLVDEHNFVRMSVLKNDKTDYPALLKNAPEDFPSDTVKFIDFRQDNGDRMTRFAVTVPVIDENTGNRICKFILWIDPDHILFPLLNSWPAESGTAEVMIVRKDGNEILFLNRLKNNKNTGINLKLPLSRSDVPAVAAVLGKKGISEGLSYSGKPVIAAIVPVADSPWFMIAWEETDELLSPLRERLLITAIIIAVLLLGLGSISGFTWQQQRMKFYKENYRISDALLQTNNELQAILENMINAFVVWKSIFDENGNYVSFRFEYFNDAYSRISGLKLEDVRDRPVSEVWPDTENDWLDIYREVAMTGKSKTFELYHEPTKGLYHCNAYRPTDSRDRICVIFEDITGSRRSVEALRKSEERLRLSIKAANHGLYDVNLQTGETIVNDEFAIMLGYDPAEFVETSAHWEERLHPDDREKAFQRLKLQMEGKVIEDQIEFRQRTKNGKWKWILSTSKVIEYDEKGIPLRMVGTHTDITERKATEEKLKESEQLYKSLFNNNYAVMLLLDPETGRISDANKAACEYFGWNYEEITKKFIHDISTLPPDIILENTNRIKMGDLNYIISRHRLSNGIIRDVEIYVGIIPVEGNPRVYNIIHDITDRKLAEKLLMEEKERLSVTLRSIGDGVITTDLNGRITIMNKIAENLTGWPSREAYGKPLASVFNIINENTRRPCKNPVDEVLATGNIIELANHTILISRDGSERVIADSGAPIKDNNSVTIGVVLVFRDMTEKQKLQESLQRTEKLNSIGIMAGGIAHDFNNLLNAIYGYIELARQEASENNINTGYLEKVMQSFDQAKDLTHQLLTFSKGGKPVRKTGTIGTILEKSTELALSGMDVPCDLDIQKELWFIDFDENQISQVFSNIIINARQAVQDTGKIAITARNIKAEEIADKKYAPVDYIKISIVDSGPGITRENLQKIFDPFFTTKSTGSGLGLATSYSIINNHDGYIEVDSEPGKGTAFHIFLPASLKKPLETGPGKILTEHKGSGAILVMDDEDYILDISGLMLGKIGYSVIKAHNGEEAIKLFTEAKINETVVKALLLDLTINGGMGGKETITKIRRIDNNIPVFASSGYSEDPVMSNPSEYGFTDSISKPYRLTELAELLNRNLGTAT